MEAERLDNGEQVGSRKIIAWAQKLIEQNFVSAWPVYRQSPRSVGSPWPAPGKHGVGGQQTSGQHIKERSLYVCIKFAAFPRRAP